MHMREAEIDEKGRFSEQRKRLGVIVLTDNRQSTPLDKPKTMDFSASGYRQTQIDPLEFGISQFTPNYDQGLILELTKRITHLEKRVEALSNYDGLPATTHQETKSERKKNRRKFKELVRNKECHICHKVYGSETSLKFHLKLKHENKSENRSENNSQLN